MNIIEKTFLQERMTAMNLPITDYTYLQNTTWRLKAQFPHLRVKPLGKSVVGRSIYRLEIGRESAPGVLLAGTFLGTDHLSSYLLLSFAEHFLESMEHHREIGQINPFTLLRDRKIVIVPVVNPDGREIHARGTHCGGIDSRRVHRLCGGDTTGWNANARGVDITHNFDFCFEKRKERERKQGVYGPDEKGYGGPHAESEPETKALADYCRQEPLLYAISFYLGRGEVFWRNPHASPNTGETMAQVLALCAGLDLEAPVGKITDTGFRNFFAKSTKKPALDVFLPPYHHAESSCDPYALWEEPLITACLF